jgi:hypothetical protein
MATVPDSGRHRRRLLGHHVPNCCRRTSSTTSTAARRQRPAASGREAARSIASRPPSPRPTPANALSVVPPSAAAARPVEAVTNVEAGGSARTMCRSSSDLPVPAAERPAVGAAAAGPSWCPQCSCLAQERHLAGEPPCVGRACMRLESQRCSPSTCNPHYLAGRHSQQPRSAAAHMRQAMEQAPARRCYRARGMAAARGSARAARAPARCVSAGARIPAQPVKKTLRPESTKSSTRCCSADSGASSSCRAHLKLTKCVEVQCDAEASVSHGTLWV